MTEAPQPHHHAADLQLQHSIDDLLARTLRAMLPPPDDDTPEAWTERDRVAIAKAGGMIPGNPEEADLAARSIACGAHADDCLRRAAENLGDLDRTGKLRAQAASMGREARSYRAMLLRVQAARRNREADDKIRDGDAWTEHCFVGLMTQALERLPPGAPPPARPAAVAEPPPPVPAAEPPPAAESPPAAGPPPPAMAGATPIRVGPRIDYDDWTDEEKARERLVADAGRVAIYHPMRVQQIRKLGGLPPDCDYAPPPPDVLHEIIHGTGSNLRWADTYVPWKPPAT
jgi:hypothetical protein